MLKVERLSASYRSIAALKGVTVRVPIGKVVSIIGTNGAGKSTLLKCISGLIEEKTGRILYKGQDISNFPAHRIVALGISQVPEGRQVFGDLTVQDNINLGAYLSFRRRDRAEVRKRTREIYTMFGILEKRSKQIAGTLSGGEQQMLAIARALMGDPELLMMDEPSMGLAPLIVKDIFNVIKTLNSSGTTILLVEQNARAALHIAHHACVLETGKIVLDGPAAELLENPRVKKAYLGA
ncbi:MAG: ABC transporter ATP-binding protein [Deltaproteobacteria bacterium]|nr:ABC transporter ATP-binding protein [Deltaproteobacteria bacterium]